MSHGLPITILYVIMFIFISMCVVKSKLNNPPPKHRGIYNCVVVLLANPGSYFYMIWLYWHFRFTLNWLLPHLRPMHKNWNKDIPFNIHLNIYESICSFSTLFSTSRNVQSEAENNQSLCSKFEIFVNWPIKNDKD